MEDLSIVRDLLTELGYEVEEREMRGKNNVNLRPNLVVRNANGLVARVGWENGCFVSTSPIEGVTMKPHEGYADDGWHYEIIV